MQTKKIRVRKEDLHHGMRLFVACPKFGIDEIVVVGKPYILPAMSMDCDKDGNILKNLKGKYKKNGNHGYFVGVKGLFRTTTSYRSLMDMGIVSNTYNNKRTFRTRKHAEEYIERMQKDPQYIRELLMEEDREQWEDIFKHADE